MEKLTLHSYDYLMNIDFKRIKENKLYDLGLRPYTQETLKKMIKYFETREEYEKCEILLNFQKKRFNHEENYHMYLPAYDSK